jgi:hypothetical protein
MMILCKLIHTTPNKKIIEGLKFLYLKSLYNFTESAYDGRNLQGTIGTKNYIQGFINLYLTNKKYFLWLLNYLAKLLAQILQNKSKKAGSLTHYR